jgi:hypothetical protein
MTNDDWNIYSEHTKFLCDIFFLRDDEYDEIDNVTDINSAWDRIQYVIKSAAKKDIKSRTSTFKNDPHPIKNSEIYRNLQYLQKLIYKFKKSMKSNTLDFILPNESITWTHIKARLFALSQEFDIRINLPEISLDNLADIFSNYQELTFCCTFRL